MRVFQLHLVSFYRLAQFLLLPPHLATFPPLPGSKQMSKEKMEAFLRSLEYMIIEDTSHRHCHQHVRGQPQEGHGRQGLQQARSRRCGRLPARVREGLGSVWRRRGVEHSVWQAPEDHLLKGNDGLEDGGHLSARWKCGQGRVGEEIGKKTCTSGNPVSISQQEPIIDKKSSVPLTDLQQ